jgi:heptosyltransferase-2
MERHPGMPPTDDVRRVGCLMLNGIGDILCVTPALAALRARYPRSRISAMIRPHLSSLLDGNPAVDDFVFYPPGAPWRKAPFVRDARARRFDLWVDLHAPTFNTVSSNARDFRRNAMLMRLAAPRYRLGFALPELRPHLTHAVPVPDADTLTRTNIVHTTLSLVQPESRGSPRKHIPVSDADRAYAAAALSGVPSDYVALFFGSRQAADLWPPERVVQFVRDVTQALPRTQFVIVGGSHEAWLWPLLQRSLEAPTLARLRNHVDRESMGRTAALLARCSALVCTDSGPMHIADAMSVPIVALFSSKNYPAIWRPLEPRSTLLNRQVDCGPCFRAECPRGNLCMQLIDPSEVVRSLLALRASTG